MQVAGCARSANCAHRRVALGWVRSPSLLHSLSLPRLPLPALPRPDRDGKQLARENSAKIAGILIPRHPDMSRFATSSANRTPASPLTFLQGPRATAPRRRIFLDAPSFVSSCTSRRHRPSVRRAGPRCLRLRFPMIYREVKHVWASFNCEYLTMGPKMK